MFVDSHCHLTFPELLARITDIRADMQAAQVDRALCICTTLEEFDAVHGLALAYDNFWASAGVHPDNEGVREPSVADLLALSGIAKAGFGLGDDRRRIISKLGIEPQGILELNTIFRERGYRKDMGVKGAVAVLFNQRFIKSKKAATSNWANPQLTEAQLVYAANDAYAAVRVFEALGLGDNAD